MHPCQGPSTTYIMLKNETWLHKLTVFKANLYTTHHGSMVEA